MKTIPDNHNTDKNNTKRNRRTKLEIEESILNAATQIIKESGFSGLTVTGISQYAEIEPPVFYNRYNNLDDFINTYVRSFDYWLQDTANFDITKEEPVENFVQVINEFIDSLIDNILMQKLIAWELAECNQITKRTAQVRDVNSLLIVDYFNKFLSTPDIRFDYVSAILIGGLYYIIMHRNLSRFNFIDFQKEESINNLKKHLRLIIYKIFGTETTLSSSNDNTESGNYKNQMVEVAKELIKNNVDYYIIQKATKLSNKVLKSLYS